jgi:hypothetical protein
MGEQLVFMKFCMHTYVLFKSQYQMITGVLHTTISLAEIRSLRPWTRPDIYGLQVFRQRLTKGEIYLV